MLFTTGSARVAAPVVPPFPVMQAVPMPGQVISFQRETQEAAAYHFGPELRRPFVFPVIGPAGHHLTRMGHPHDPAGHSHHNSVWISHHDVNGVSFWEDSGPGRILHRGIVRLDDGPDTAGVLTTGAWLDGEGKTLFNERRLTAVHSLPGRELLLEIDLELAAEGGPVTFGATPFGLIGVRMAKTVGVTDGGGRILNSDGGGNEAGTFRKPARWVDYSGRVTPDAVEGLALMDHPSNPRHPAPFHTRDDGWMGACISKDEPLVVQSAKPLRLRYALYVHAGEAAAETIDARWREFAASPAPPLDARK
jgi:hypothetical protein